MVDQKYELLIVVRTELEIEDALARVRDQFSKFDQAGAQAFGASGKTAQGAKNLAGIQGVLASAASGATGALAHQGAKTAELADVLNILTTSAKEGADVQRFFSNAVKGVPVEILKQVAASRDLIAQQALLARALGVTGDSTELAAKVTHEIPGEYAQVTAATRIAGLAQKEWSDRVKESTKASAAFSGIGQTIAAAQKDTAQAFNKTIAATEAFVAGSNLVPAALAKSEESIRGLTGIHKTLQVAQGETIKATESFVAGANLIPNVLAKYRDDLAGTSAAHETLRAAQAETLKETEAFVAGSNLIPNVLAKGSAATRELDRTFLGINTTSKSVAFNLKEFETRVSGVSEAQLRAIASASKITDSVRAYGVAAGGVGNALNLSGQATRLFATSVSDLEGRQRQGIFTTKAAGIAAGELERRTILGRAAQREAAIAADQHRGAVENLSKTLVSVASVAGNQMLRLAGVTSGFAGQTLGRTFLTGVAGASRSLSTFEKDVESTTAATAGMAEEASGAGTAVAGMGGTVGVATAVIAVAAATTLGTVAAFQKLAAAGIEVSKAFEQVAVRAPKAAFAELQRSVFELSGATGVAFEGLAAATGRALLKVGGDAGQANRLVKIATDLALAGSEDLGVSVERLGDIMRTYGLSIAEVKDVSNLLLLSQVNSREEFSKIADGLTQLAPQANKLGISLKDLGAALTGIVASGVPAQQATFGLRSVFSELEKETSATRKTLRGLQVDLSPEAFKSKGVIGVFQDMERALNRNNSSLSKFLGESRRFPTVLALLGNAAAPAKAVLAGLASGADQAADGLAKLQNLPGRQIANFLNQLRTLFFELGTALSTVLGPGLEKLTKFLHELNEIAAEHPEVAIEVVAAGIESLTNSFVQATTKIPFFGTVMKELGTAIIPSVGKAVDDATKKLADLRQKFGTGIKAPSVEDFKLGDAKIPTKQITEITEALSEAGRRLQGVFDVDIEKTFVKSLSDLVEEGGSADEIIRKLDDALTKHGEVVRAAAAFTFEFDTASEKQAAAMEESAIKTNVLVELFKKFGVNIDTLVTKINRQREEQKATNDALALQEKLGLSARRGLDAYVAGLFRFGPAQQAARLALKSFADDIARLNELVKKGGTGDSKKSPFDIARDLTKAKSAFEGIDSAIDGWQDGQRTVIQQLDIIIARAEEYAKFAETFGADGVEAARKIREEISRFKSTILAEQQGGFGSGFTRGIDDFIKHAQDGFAIGRESAQEFAGATVDAMTQFLASIGRGKAGIKDFAIALIQAIQQMIAKIIALRIASAIFGNLFLSGGGSGGSASDAFNNGGGDPFLARGGPAKAGKPYIVGEKGPELFVPDQPGTVVPYAKTLLALGSAPRSAFGESPRIATRGIPRAGARGGIVDRISAAAPSSTRAADIEIGGAPRAAGPSAIQTVVRLIQRIVTASSRGATSSARAISNVFGSGPASAFRPTAAVPGGHGAADQEVGAGSRARFFATGGVHRGQMAEPASWPAHMREPVRMETGGIIPGFIRSLFGLRGARAPEKPKAVPTFRLVAQELQVGGGASPLKAEGILKLVGGAQGSASTRLGGSALAAAQGRFTAPGGAATAGGLAKLAAGIAIAVAPLAAAAPARASIGPGRSAPAATSSQRSVAVERVSRALTRARLFADGGIMAGSMGSVAHAPGVHEDHPRYATGGVHGGTVRAVTPAAARPGSLLRALVGLATKPDQAQPIDPKAVAGGARATTALVDALFNLPAPRLAGQVPTSGSAAWPRAAGAEPRPRAGFETRTSASIARSLRSLAVPLARVIRAIPALRGSQRTQEARQERPSDVGMDLARTVPGASARTTSAGLAPGGSGGSAGSPGSVIGGVTRFIRTAGQAIAELARGVPTVGRSAQTAGARRGGLGIPAFESGGVARGIVTAIESAGGGVERRVAQEARAVTSGRPADAATGSSDARPRPSSGRGRGDRTTALPLGILSGIVSAVSRIATTATGLVAALPEPTARAIRSGSTGSRSSTAPAGARLPGGREPEPERVDFLGRAGSVLQRWAGVVRQMSAREFAMGGIATTPSMAIFAEKPGMAEAFVPLPGPNRGIPVEFKNGGGGGRNVTVNITLVSQSLDPRTAGDVILAQMPQIQRALATAIEETHSSVLNRAIRGIGR